MRRSSTPIAKRQFSVGRIAACVGLTLLLLLAVLLIVVGAAFIATGPADAEGYVVIDFTGYGVVSIILGVCIGAPTIIGIRRLAIDWRNDRRANRRSSPPSKSAAIHRIQIHG